MYEQGSKFETIEVSSDKQKETNGPTTSSEMLRTGERSPTTL